MINKLMGLLKSSSSKEKNVKINRLAYVTNSTFKGNNYVDRFCKIRNSTIGKYSYIAFILIIILLVLKRPILNLMTAPTRQLLDMMFG